MHACVPVTGQAFGKLLSLLSIEASDEVPTACVTTGARSRLLVNPEFVARHCRTDEHLAMLVLHELYHVLLGHTRLYPRVTPAQNWAFDCLINAQLCRLFPIRATPVSSRRLVTAPKGRRCCSGRRPRQCRTSNYPTATARRRRRQCSAAVGRALAPVRRRVGDHRGAVPSCSSYIYLADGVRRVRPAAPGQPRHPGCQDPSDDARCTPKALREVRDIVARWLMALAQRSGRDQGASAARASA